MTTTQCEKVQLWAGDIPYLGWLACHYWLEVHSSNNVTRYEVWQRRDQNAQAIGYLHRNLLPAGSWLKNTAWYCEHEWRGQQAIQLNQALIDSLTHYPHRNRYLFWPGPNSNSYIQWVLKQANCPYSLGRRAIGKRYITDACFEQQP